MKKSFTIIALFIAVVGFSQTTIEKSSISSGGTSTTNGTLSIISTIGEVAIQETTNGTIHISEGFLSSKTLKTLGVKKFKNSERIQVYPNPTVDFVNIRFETLNTYEIYIFDSLGKQLNNLKTNKLTKQLDFKNYSKGVYLILIKDSKNQLYKSLKLIKN